MNTKVAKKNNKGFTLIELIVVIAIIAVLAAILAPQYLRYVEKSRVSTDCQTAAEIMNATRTACAEETVYDNLDPSTNTVVWGTVGQITVTTGAKSNKALKDEVLTTITGDKTKETVARKSKTLTGNGIWRVTITPKTDNGTVTINGEWTGLTDTSLAADLTRKSGGTKSNS